MANPGLAAFAFGTIRSPGHPLNTDPFEDDPYLEDGDNDSDYMPSASFGRWRTPGQTTRVPTQVGPPFAPGETPEDVIHGEVISPEEEAGADSILKGEHESAQPSNNPDVEAARQDLHTPESAVAVDTLTRLLRGVHPNSMGQESMDAAHEWLRQRFTGLRVNPRHGTLVAMSPTGKQMVKRETHLPAIPEHTPEEPTYTLVNKHGTFESRDPQQLVRAMIAFQIVHSTIARKKQDDDDDSLTATSGLLHDLFHGGLGKQIIHNVRHGVPTFNVPHDAVFEPGAGTDQNNEGKKGGWVSSSGLPGWHHDPRSGVYYSPGHSMGEMLDPVKARKPLPDPYYPGHTYTYAPNPESGHTIERRNGGLTYFVNRLHPAARGRGFDIPPTPPPARPMRPVKSPKRVRTSPASPPAASAEPPMASPKPEWWTPIGQLSDADLKPAEEPSGLLPEEQAAIDNVRRRRKKGSSAQVNDLCPVCASGYLEPYDNDHHECLNCGSLVTHVGFEKESSRSRKHPRGLGRGLADIMPYEGDPLDLASGGSENPDAELPEGSYVHPLADEELDPDVEMYEAPRRILGRTSALVNRVVNDEDNLRFFKDTDFPAPAELGSINYGNQPMINFKRINTDDNSYGEDWDSQADYSPGDVCESCYLLDGKLVEPKEHEYRRETLHPYKPFENNQRFSSVTDPIDEFMGKQGFQPIHKPGQSRVYMMPLIGAPGAFARLTEGVPTASGEPSGWSLTADNIPDINYTKNDVPTRHIPIERHIKDPKKAPPPPHATFRQVLPDPHNRMVGDKTFLASGSHPIKDDALNRAIRDVSRRGRRSTPYWNALNQSSYEMPDLPPDTGTQRERRMLSSVQNPGLTVFAK